MKHSHLDTYESLLKQSLLIPELVTKAANKDINFIENLNQWLLNTEEIMRKYNISKCSEIAGLRSKIIASSYVTQAKVSKRKRLFSVATTIIYDAQSTVLSTIEPMENRIEEARDSIRQLLGVAYQADMLNPNMDFNEMVQTLWSTFSTHEQLKGAVASILVLVNRSDALRMLAEEIDISGLPQN
jgi:hypothetical protein